VETVNQQITGNVWNSQNPNNDKVPEWLEIMLEPKKKEEIDLEKINNLFDRKN